MSQPLSSTSPMRREWVEWAGVGLLPFLPCKQNAWGSRIEGGVRNRRISNSSLNSGEFTFYSFEDLGCGHVQAKSQKQCSPPKGVRTGKKKKKRPFQFFPIYACPLFPPYKLPEKMNTPIRQRTSATDDPLHRPATRQETPHNKSP